MKLDTALLTGQDADLYMNYTLNRLQKRVDAGTAVDLSGSGYDIDGQMGPDAAQWKINDNYYGIPTKKNMGFIWLNKKMLDEAGLPVPPMRLDLVRSAGIREEADEGRRLRPAAARREFTATIDGTVAGLGVTKPDGTSNFDNDLWKQQFQILHDMMFVESPRRNTASS